MDPRLRKVIVALDYADPLKAYRLVEEIGDLIDCFKIGPVLFTCSGLDVVHFLHRQRKKIFLDLKLHDTPNVVAETVRQYGDLGVSYATVHASGGPRMLNAASIGCRGSVTRLIAVTVLTSQRARDATGGTVDDPSLPAQLVKAAVDARLAGVLCAPQELKTLRAAVPEGFQLVAAGIRIPGEEVYKDDQERVASPEQADRWGADWLVVGRPILHAREPRKALARLFPAASSSASA
jgi:orotidine-5'-phosphate decarboxylase